MKIEIEAFANGQLIPSRFSKEGGNVSPGIAFRDVPRGAKSLALVLDDPDAPRGLFTHWVVYNIDPTLGGFHENQVPEVATQGKNSWGETSYGGPQPPDREHRYYFHLYALDVPLPMQPGADRAELLRRMEGHVMDHVDYMGRFAPATAQSSLRRAVR